MSVVISQVSCVHPTSNQLSLHQQHTDDMMLIGSDQQIDEHSTSSTIPTVSCCKGSPLQGQQPNRKRVHFSSHIAYNDATTPHDSWYTAEDYKVYRETTLREVQHIIETERRVDRKQSLVWERIYMCCCQGYPVSSAEYFHLQKWMNEDLTRVGLERWCVKKLSQDKSRRRRAIVAQVRQAQELSMSSEDLRMASIQWSYASSGLAQAIAQGLANSLD